MCSYVPEDVMVSIFERLPIKFLLRFRSLSKYWYSRIASPEFIRNHPLRSDQKVLIRHLIKVTDVNFIDMYTLHSPSGYVKPGVELAHYRPDLDTVGSCNGIICLLEFGISLWNFSIRRKLTLPRHPSFKDEISYPGKAAFGFGFDPVTDDYKVVAISYLKYTDGVAHNEDSFIYSLKTNSWDSIISSPPTPFIHAWSKACFFNGTLHWVVVGLVHEPPIETSIIMTFNLFTHAFGTISLPTSFGKRGQITTINGSLALVSLKHGYNRIWVMSEYDNAKSWSVYL
uniref:F-box/kelch-repeat protein At3g06240-like n=1 Tax=Erigeron canadensis TaxID=72917 RepID=UPI001CB98BC3|nr:F-box/kelch-repeat protein At3g06240-like [Erigeron canadensis]